MTTTFKYQLRKGGRKMVCPQCGQRRFVPYVLTEDNETIVNPDWGRCDRENSCGYWMKPSGNVQVPEAKVVAPVEPLRFLGIFGEFETKNSLLPYASWLIGSGNAEFAFERYHVKSCYGDWCLFWQVAKDGSVRAGKAIRYVNGHRDKTQKPPVRWLHKDKRFKKFFKGEVLEQCFFGEHLLDGVAEGTKVAVVESEKTALLMSAIRPQYIWLAAGGSCNLSNPSKNKVLDGYDVTVFPDNGMFIKWRQIALPKGWKVNEVCLPQRDGMKEGYDVLDLYEKWAIDEEMKQTERLFVNREGGAR